MSTWIKALKIFNKDGMWCMPRKGTAEHAEVMKIMDKIKSTDQKRIADAPNKVKRRLRSEKEKKESSLMAMEDRDAPVTPNKVKRKLRTEKEKKEASLMAMEDRDAPEMKKPKPVVVAPAVKKPKKTKKKKVKVEEEEDEGYGTDETKPEPLPDIYIDPRDIPKNIRANEEEKNKWLKNEYMRQYNMLPLKNKIEELKEDYLSTFYGNEGFPSLQLVREELEKLMKENPKSKKKIKKIIDEGRQNEERRRKK